MPADHEPAGTTCDTGLPVNALQLLALDWDARVHLLFHVLLPPLAFLLLLDLYPPPPETARQVSAQWQWNA